MVTRGDRFDTSALSKARSLFREMRLATEKDDTVRLTFLRQDWNKCEGAARELIRHLGEYGSRVLCRRLKDIEYNQEGSVVCLDERNKIHRVVSGFVAGRRPPCLSDFNVLQCCVRVFDERIRSAQRIVSARNVYGTTGLRQDCVIIECEQQCTFCILFRNTTRAQHHRLFRKLYY